MEVTPNEQDHPMKTKTTRQNALPSQIVRDTTRQPVTDDLAGLESLLPEAPSEAEQLAIFRSQLPPLLDLRGRGQAHTEQVQRLIKALAKEPHLVETWIDTANALTILTNSAHLALMQLPARTEDDIWTRQQFGRHLLNRARAHGDREDIALARRVIGKLPRLERTNLLRDPEGVKEMLATMLRRAAALRPAPTIDGEAGKPGVHTLEQADSLEAFFAAAPDLGDLLDQARTLLAWMDSAQAPGLGDEGDEAAHEGALILAYARLMRVALWPARNATDVAAKTAARALVDERSADPDRHRALFAIAWGQGETIAGQSLRFIQVDNRED
jgi:hypothetical protein